MLGPTGLEVPAIGYGAMGLDSATSSTPPPTGGRDCSRPDDDLVGQELRIARARALQATGPPEGGPHDRSRAPRRRDLCGRRGSAAVRSWCRRQPCDTALL